MEKKNIFSWSLKQKCKRKAKFQKVDKAKGRIKDHKSAQEQWKYQRRPIEMIKIYYNSERGIKKKSWDAKNIGPKPRILVISDINFINQWDLITSLTYHWKYNIFKSHKRLWNIQG